MKRFIVILLVVTFSVFMPIMSFPIFADYSANSIMLGNYDVVNKNFPNANGNGNNEYQSIVIMATTDNKGIITLPTVDEYEIKTDLSTDYSKVVNLTKAKTANEIAKEYISKITFVNESSDKDMSVSISLSSEETKLKTFYFANNDHYYQYVPFTEKTLNWIDAYNAAKERSYQGRQGYLATITSLEEDLFIYKASAGSVGWLGGTILNHGTKQDDSQYYESFDIDNKTSQWYWACGPEIGNIFYKVARNTDIQGFNGNNRIDILANNMVTYHNWATEGSGANNIKEYAEPNGNGQETCLTTLPFGFGYSTQQYIGGTKEDKYSGTGSNEFCYGKYSWNNIAYNRNDGKVWCPQGYMVEYGNQIIGDSNTKDISKNYISVSTTIYKGKQLVTPPTINDKAYTGETLIADISDTNEPYSITTNNGDINVGQYNVVLTINDTNNYKWPDCDDATKTLVFNITKANNSWISNPSIASIPYGDTVSATSKATFGTATISYVGIDGTTYEECAEPPTNPGKYKATFTVNETNNYTGLIEEVEFNIFNSSTTTDGYISTAILNTNENVKDANLKPISKENALNIVGEVGEGSLKQAINNGKNVIIYTEVENPSDESKLAFTSMNINETNAVILDINLYGEIVGEANSKKKIADTNGYKTTVSITLTPEQASKINIANNKNYFILRQHANKIEKIPAALTIDANNNYVFTFETDKFSAYAIYSEYKPAPTSEPKQDDTPRYRVPNTRVEGTYSNNHSLIKLSSLSLLAIGTCMVIKKKKDN